MDTGNNGGPNEVIYLGSNKVFILWKEDGSVLKAQIGTISGSSLSLGTAVTVNSVSTSADNLAAAYVSSTSVIMVWNYGGGNGDKGFARAASISGTTITLGTETNFANNNAVGQPNIVWDASAQRAVVVYRKSSKATYSLLSISGTTLTVEQDLQDVGDGSYIESSILTYDSTAEKTVVMYRDTANDKLKLVCMDVGSSSITQGTQVVRDANRFMGTDKLSATFVPGINKVGYAYILNSNGGDDALTIRVGTVSLSGTTITLNENTALDHDNINDYTYLLMSSDNNGNILITYDDNDSGNPDKLRGLIGTYSGNTFVTSSLADFTIINSLLYAGRFSQCFTDSTNNKFVHFGHQSVGQGQTTQGYVAHVIGGVDDLISFNNWIGLSSQSVSNGASVKVTVQSGLNENQSSLSVGSKYYIQNDGTVGTTLIENRQIGIATAATKLFLTNGTIEIGPTGYNAN